MTVDRIEVGSGDLRWVQQRDFREVEIGEIGVPRDRVTQERLRFMDGFLVGWSMVFAKFDVLSVVASLYQAGFPDEAEAFSRHGTGVVEAPVPVPMILLDIPDYPDSEGTTFVADLDAAERAARLILENVNEARRTMSREIRVQMSRADRRRMERAEKKQMSCAIAGCNRQRQFFDDKGIGFCKRHADERGIRPRGKVS